MAAAAYARIASDLRGKITSRNIKPGGQLPTELELRGKYGASRNTVLDAIKLLKDEGLVETRPGQGWFATVRIVPFVNSIDWEDSTAIKEAITRGRKPRATSPIVSRTAAPPEIAERLRVPVSTEMAVRRQDWSLDDLPWKMQTVWCPMARFDEGARRLLVAEDIEEGVGSYLYTALGLSPAGDTFYFLPRKPNPDELRFFGFSDENGAPYVIELTRTATSVDDSGSRPLYAAVGVYAGDRNRFESSGPTPPRERTRLLPTRSTDAYERPGGPGAGAWRVQSERPLLAVLPADGQRQPDEGTDARTGDDGDHDEKGDDTGHDRPPSYSLRLLADPR